MHFVEFLKSLVVVILVCLVSDSPQFLQPWEYKKPAQNEMRHSEKYLQICSVCSRLYLLVVSDYFHVPVVHVCNC